MPISLITDTCHSLEKGRRTWTLEESKSRTRIGLMKVPPSPVTTRAKGSLFILWGDNLSKDFGSLPANPAILFSPVSLFTLIKREPSDLIPAAGGPRRAEDSTS